MDQYLFNEKLWRHSCCSVGPDVLFWNFLTVTSLEPKSKSFKIIKIFCKVQFINTLVTMFTKIVYFGLFKCLYFLNIDLVHSDSFLLLKFRKIAII